MSIWIIPYSFTTLNTLVFFIFQLQHNQTVICKTFDHYWMLTLLTTITIVVLGMIIFLWTEHVQVSEPKAEVIFHFYIIVQVAPLQTKNTIIKNNK